MAHIPYSPEAVASYQAHCKRLQISIPTLQVVLGSGFGTALEKTPEAWSFKGELAFKEIPGLNPSTAPDHKGAYRFYENKKTKKTIAFQMGRLHGYEGNSPQQVVAPLLIPRLAGVSSFLLTNAAGGLKMEYKPGEVMLIRDHVNFTGKNPLLGENPHRSEKEEIGPRFPDLCGMYDFAWKEALKHSLEAQGIVIHEGTYLGVLGPSFETPAEVSLFAAWGMGAVGMSTVWEAIAIRHSGAKLAGLSLISNLGAGMGGGVALDHNAILATCRAAAEKIVRGIFALAEKEV